MIEQGAKAPDFTLPDQDGNEVSLSDFQGQTVVLYFYPKADTPGCTTQACGVRDHLPDYQGLGAVIMGISPDPVQAVKRFHDGQGLNFTLLADEEFGKDLAAAQDIPQHFLIDIISDLRAGRLVRSHRGRDGEAARLAGEAGRSPRAHPARRAGEGAGEAPARFARDRCDRPGR